MSNKTTYVAWILLTVALCAWAAVGFLAQTIQSKTASHHKHAADSLYSSSQASRMSALQSLVGTTAKDRASLSAIAVVDPASLSDMVTNAGVSMGIPISITDANSLTGVPVASTGAAGALPIQAFTFVANASGNFASMIYVESLLESLPVPSSIQHLNLSNVVTQPGAVQGKLSWQLNAQIKVVTASGL